MLINNVFPCLVRLSCLDVFPVLSCDDLSSENPILLKPWEHYAFLFRIIHHESQMALHKVGLPRIMHSIFRSFLWLNLLDIL